MKMAAGRDGKGRKRKYIDDPVQCSSGREEDEVFDFTKETWMSDVTLVVKERRLYASKTILALQSPVFRAMFGSDFSERNKKTVELPGKRYDDVLQFLKCLLPNKTTEITNCHSVRAILPLAHEYQVDVLIQKCERFLLDFITTTWLSTSFLIALFKLAETFNLHPVVNIIMEKLIDVDPREIFEIEEVRASPVLHQKLTESYFDRYKKHQLEVIKTHIDRDGVLNVPGFEEAQGLTAAMTINRSECLLLLEDGEKVLAKSVLSVWNLKCMLSCCLVANTNPDGRLSPSLKFAVCIWKPDAQNDSRWQCQTTMKLSFKSRRFGTGTDMKTKFKGNLLFSDSNKAFLLFKAEVADFLKPSSKYVIEKKVECELYVLSNQPTTGENP